MSEFAKFRSRKIQCKDSFVAVSVPSDNWPGIVTLEVVRTDYDGEGKRVELDVEVDSSQIAALIAALEAAGRVSLAKQEGGKVVRYGIRVEEKQEFGRQVLTIWTGAFSEQYEGHAVALPGGDGFMVHLAYQDSIRVTCPTPRDENNYAEVDKAINDAIHRTAQERLKDIYSKWRES